MSTDRPALHDLAWPRRTARLLLRPPAVGDAAALFAYKSLPEVSRWTTGAPGSPQELAENLADAAWAAKMLVLELGGTVVGDLYVAVGDAWGQRGATEPVEGVQAEIGWSLDPARHGRGLAREATAALLDVLFEELGLRRVTAECFAANEPSWRLMERLGMRRETHAVRDSLHRELGWLDGYGYALLAEEWRAARSISRDPDGRR